MELNGFNEIKIKWIYNYLNVFMGQAPKYPKGKN